MFIQLRQGLVDLEEYNRYKNNLSGLLRRSRKNYFSEKFDNFNGNIAKSWKLLNTLLGRGKRSTPSKGVPSAGCFNKYFSSIAAELDSKIPYVDASPVDYLGARVLNSFFANPCSVSEVATVISRFVTKGSPIGEIPVFIYKSVSNIIAPYLAELFNESIECGTFPTCLKTARVVPIHKKDDPALPSNHRPISTLPVMSKLFELLMHVRIVKYLDSLNILSRNQFGFRAMRGTNDAIIDIYEHVFSSFEKSEHSVAVLLDFSKAFDTVSHKILLEKLEHIGVRGRCLAWFHSYLSERRQYVQVGNDSSESVEINFGVPQGSVLGPLLFIIYINDMCFSSTLLKFVHYADDSTVFLSHRDLNELFTIVERELENVVKWLSVNRLSINIGKTVYMLFSNQTVPVERAIMMNGVALKRVEDREFLGIIMENNLCFREQINNICKKLSRGTGVMYRMSGVVPRDVLKKIYFAIVYPYLCYAVISWGGSGVGNCSRVTRAHRRAVKLLGSTGNLDYLSSNNLLSFESVHDYFVLIKMFRTIHQGNHESLADQLNQLRPDHNYSTRFEQTLNFNIPKYKKATSHRSFLYRGVSLWNSLPIDVKNCNSLISFKGKLKHHLKLVQDTSAYLPS